MGSGRLAVSVTMDTDRHEVEVAYEVLVLLSVVSVFWLLVKFSLHRQYLDALTPSSDPDLSLLAKGA